MLIYIYIYMYTYSFLGGGGFLSKIEVNALVFWVPFFRGACLPLGAAAQTPGQEGARSSPGV